MKAKKNLDYDDEFKIEKGSSAGIIVLILMMALVGGLGYYYFAVVDSAKNLFMHIYDKMDGIYTDRAKESNKLNINYSLSTKLKINNLEYKNYEIINNLSVSGVLNHDDDTNYLTGLLNYKSDKLVSFTSKIVTGNESELFVKYDDVYDKVIKYEPDEEMSEYDYDVNNYKVVLEKVKDAFKYALDNATYEKEYIKLDKEYVKKYTLVVNKEFIENMYNKLSQDKEYMDNLSKITGEKISEIQEGMEKELADIKDNDVDYISVYTKIFTSEFIKLEGTNEDDNFTFYMEDNKYIFEYMEGYNLKFSGYFKYNEVSEDKSVTLGLDFIDDKIGMEIYLIYSDTKEKVELDTKDYILSDDISEKDMEKIYAYMGENETIMNFLEILAGEEEEPKKVEGDVL